MKIQLYALVTPARRTRIRDVHGTPLRLVTSRRLGALVGEVRRKPAPTPQALRAYHEVMAEIGDHYAAMLPARFGALLEDESELAFVLKSRRASFLHSLAHVRRRVQMTVRIGGTSAARVVAIEASPARSGADYLRARAASQRALAEIPECRAIRNGVQRWVRDERIERHNDIVTMYHLLARGAVARYERAVARLALTPGVRLHVSGPFPPFAFADPLASAPRARRAHREHRV